MSEIWVLVDTTADGKVRNVTYEVLTAAVKLKKKILQLLLPYLLEKAQVQLKVI